MTPDHKALCDRLLAPWFTNGCAEYQREAAEAITTLSAREAALIDTIARLTEERGNAVANATRYLDRAIRAEAYNARLIAELDAQDNTP